MPSDTTDPVGPGGTADETDAARPGPHGDPLLPRTEGGPLVGATGADTPNPDALVEGNRVATAEDME